MGALNFSVSSIIAGLIFGSIGFVAFIYGKKESSFAPMLIGIALMVYPYFITNVILVYAVGVLLTLSLYIFKD